MELRKIYYRVGIHKLMESLFNTFIIYSSLKLQIDNPLGVLLAHWSGRAVSSISGLRPLPRVGSAARSPLGLS
jgi:hypothetical protein